MYIYNVTINIIDEVNDEWLYWMKELHMPDVMKTGCFLECQLLKVLNVDDEGHTYSAQYKFFEMSNIERYQKDFAPKLQAEHSEKFKNQYSAFRTLLQIV